VAGEEGPNSGAESGHDQPDASNRKTEAQGALWKRPNSSDGASGPILEVRSIMCWPIEGARDLTRCGSVRSWLDVSGHHLTVGAQLSTIGIKHVTLKGRDMWTARSDRTQGLACSVVMTYDPVASGCAL
jgi:hypothetical protein